MSLIGLLTKTVRRVEALGHSSQDSRDGRGDGQSQQQKRRTPPKPTQQSVTIDTYINTNDSHNFQDNKPYVESADWQRVIQSIGKMLDTKA